MGLCAIAVVVICAISTFFSPKVPPAPNLIYFPVAGRGELCRLIAAAGGLKMKETNAPAERQNYDKAKYGSPSGLPLLEHGDLKISQSAAIEMYLASLVPKFATLTPAQQATDRMFASIKEDVLVGCAKVVFGGSFVKDAPTEVPKHCDKWFAVVEGLLPKSGFVHGLAFPTVADLAVLNMARACASPAIDPGTVVQRAIAERARARTSRPQTCRSAPPTSTASTSTLPSTPRWWASSSGPPPTPACAITWPSRPRSR